jgi:hypothetical protein
MDEQGIPLEEAPYGEYLKILRKEGYEKEAEEFETEFTRIFHDLGYSKEDLFATSLKSVQEIVEIYAEEVQRQVTFAMESKRSFPISGTALAGKDVDEETINRVAAIQMRMHEETKNRMMYG